MIDFLSAPWKLGTIAFGALSLGLCAKVVILNHQNGNLRDQLTVAQANLVTAQDNEKRLESAISDQNAAIKRLSDESSRRIAQSEAALAEAKRQTREAQMRAGALLKTPIKGDNLEQRVLDVDAKVLGGLK